MKLMRVPLTVWLGLWACACSNDDGRIDTFIPPTESSTDTGDGDGDTDGDTDGDASGDGDGDASGDGDGDASGDGDGDASGDGDGDTSGDGEGDISCDGPEDWPACTPKCAISPRILVLLDASSSMLNVYDGNDGFIAGPRCATPWDRARKAIAGKSDSLYDVPYFDTTLGDEAMIGLAVWGHNSPSEEKLVVDIGPCTRDNIAWSLDPDNSCVSPDCDDAWSPPPRTWTFQDGSLIDPFFDVPTLSHMPQCADEGVACAGSGTYTHRGLNVAIDTMEASMDDAPDAPHFILLITDGPYGAYSDNSQVRSKLEELYDSGVTTFVIGYGSDTDPAELQDMAQWGSGDQHDALEALSLEGLVDAFETVVSTLIEPEIQGVCP